MLNVVTDTLQSIYMWLRDGRRWDEVGRRQWRGLGRRELLKIYLSNYALLRANIKISLNSLSTQQLRNMWGTGDAGLGF